MKSRLNVLELTYHDHISPLLGVKYDYFITYIISVEYCGRQYSLGISRDCGVIEDR